MKKIFFRNLGKFDFHLQEVIKGSILACILKLTSAGLVFSFNVILARLLGTEEIGVYFLAFSIITVATTIGNFGLNNTVLRFVASMLSEQNWAAVKGAFEKALLLVFLCSLLITLVVMFIAPYLAVDIFRTPKLEFLLKWMALAILPFCIAQIYAHGLKGMKLLRIALIVEGISIVLFSILFIIFLIPNFGLLGGVWAYVIACCLTALLDIFYWQRLNGYFYKVKGHFATSQLISSCLPLFWASVFVLISNQAATFLLGIWGTTKDIAVFNVAIRCSGLISFVLVSINQVIAPRFAALYQQGNMLVLEKIARKSTIFMTLFASPLLMLMLFFPNEIMGLFGDEFKQEGEILVILALGQFVNVATGSVGFLLAMTGYESLLAQITLFIALFSCIVLIVLIQFMGIKGAALATSIAVMLQNIILLWLVRKKLSINMLWSF